MIVATLSAKAATNPIAVALGAQRLVEADARLLGLLIT